MGPGDRITIERLEPRRLLAAFGPDAFGHVGDPTTYEAVDLVLGAPGVIQHTGIGGQLNLGSAKFRFYGTDYSSLYVLSNGLITLSAPNGISPTQPNSDLHTPVDGWSLLNPQQGCIAVLWDDWQSGIIPGSGDLNFHGVLYKYDPDNLRLIIEWNDVWAPGVSGNGVTFQVMLGLNSGTTDGSIKMNFVDLDTGSAPSNNGGSSTVGIKRQGSFTPTDYLLTHYNTPADTRVQSGKAIRITQGTPAATTASISGQAFWDYDIDKSLDNGESAMSGVTVFLDMANFDALDDFEPRRVTGASGDFSFANLPAGTYQLYAVETATYVPFARASVTVAAGQAATANFSMMAWKYTGGSGDDEYTVRFKSGSTSQYEVTQTGGPTTITSLSPVAMIGKTITFAPGGGDDTLIIENANGVIRTICYDGGDNATAAGDLLRIEGSTSTNTSQRPTLTNYALGPANNAIAISAERVTLGIAAGQLFAAILSLGAETSVTVNGGSGADDLLLGDITAFGSIQNCDTIDGDVTFNGGGGTDILGWRDLNYTAAGVTYTVTPFTITRTGTGVLTHAQVESVVVSGGGTGAAINVTGSAAGVGLSVAGNGSPTITLGPNLSNFATALALTSGNTYVLRDEFGGDDTYTVTTNQVTRPGFVGVTPNGATVVIDAMGGNDVLNLVNSLVFDGRVRFNGGEGDDTANFAFAPSATCTVNGGNGADALVLNQSSGVNNVSITATSLAGGGIAYSALESMRVNLGGGNDSATVNGVATSTALTLDLGDGNDRVTFSGATSIPVTVLASTASSEQDTLIINAGSPVLGSSAALAALTLGGSSSAIDLGDYEISTAGNAIGTWIGTNYTDLSGLIAAGRIFSSTQPAVGVAPLAGRVRIRGTYRGDATLDRIINGDDFFAIDAAYPQHLAGWERGDFDYSGMIDADDYFLIDANYNHAHAAALVVGPAALSAAVELPGIAQISKRTEDSEKTPLGELL